VPRLPVALHHDMPRRVFDNLYQLSLPTPFAVGPVNVYLATDDPITLIDTGPRAEATQAALENELRALGLTASGIRRILITHAHSDHFGLAAEIARRGSLPGVWSHVYNRAWLEDYVTERVNRLAFYSRLLVESGVPPDERKRMEVARRGAGRVAESVTVIREIGEGDRLDFAGKSWIALHTPGHAGGMVCFFDPESRVLISSDHLLRDISSNPIVEPPAVPGDPKPRRLVEYLREMKRVADLHPTVAWTGHGEPVTDVGRLVRQRLAFHSRRAQRIIETIGGGEMTAYQIGLPLFGRLDPTDSFLALSEVIGHLEWLEDQRRVASELRSETRYWRSAKI